MAGGGCDSAAQKTVCPTATVGPPDNWYAGGGAPHCCISSAARRRLALQQRARRRAPRRPTSEAGELPTTRTSAAEMTTTTRGGGRASAAARPPQPAGGARGCGGRRARHRRTAAVAATPLDDELERVGDGRGRSRSSSSAGRSGREREKLAGPGVERRDGAEFLVFAWAAFAVGKDGEKPFNLASHLASSRGPVARPQVGNESTPPLPREARAAGLFGHRRLLIARARAAIHRASRAASTTSFRVSLREPSYGAPAGEEEARLLSGARLVVSASCTSCRRASRWSAARPRACCPRSGCLHILWNTSTSAAACSTRTPWAHRHGRPRHRV